ncbi:hypothetical protein FKM82_023464, partial [Ascaphus truei]
NDSKLDRTGTLSFVEFDILWLKLQKYMEIYKKVDINCSGTMDSYEMRNSLQEAGFTLNNKIQEIIVQRYASDDLLINFDGFIACMIRLETVFKMFELLERKKSGVINLSLPEWLCFALV